MSVIPAWARPSVAQQGGAKEHVVQAGDTLWDIAKKYGCTVEAVRVANPKLTPERLRLGARLEIPPCNAASGTSGRAPAAARTPAAPKPGGTTHRVKAGDFLERIAKKYGCTVGQLQHANGMRTDVIYAGSNLHIPDCSAPDTPASIPRRPVRPVRRPAPDSLDTGTLSSLMASRGFHPPAKFKAYVHVVEFDEGRTRVIRERSWDWEGTSNDVAGWNAASTVKLLAAVGALMRVQAWGFSPKAHVTFHGRGGDVESTVTELVLEALGPSNNIAYNQLVILAGFDWLHEVLFGERYGLEGTALRRAYERKRWMSMGESPSFRESPPITLREGGESKQIPRREGEVEVACRSAACASLAALAECMRRLMLQEQLPPEQSFGLERDHLVIIRKILRTERKRGDEVVDALSAHIRGDRVRLYHKAGFSENWYSDVVYIYDPSQPRAWIVALAGYPGRNSLTQAATVIGSLLADGALQ